MADRRYKCGKKARHQRTLCERCSKRNWYRKYPLKYIYANLRSHATERYKEFTITFAEFCAVTASYPDFVEGYGRGTGKYTIDRKNSNEGYIPGNLQILIHEINSAKGDSTFEESWMIPTPDVDFI